jgi:undecaprenyl-diphosphatase
MLGLIAVVLGIVQGVGEFLPVSSSAHLIIVRWLFAWDAVIKQAGVNIDIALDVALHVGTLLAVLIYFAREWVQLVGSGIMTGLKTREGKMFWYLVAATIPGGVAGLLLESRIEHLFRSQPLVMAAGLAVMGIILYYADKNSRQRIRYENITFTHAMLIGTAQALALIPGVSRSGITMTAGRLLGFSREAAAKFSFLLATPIIAGAALKHTPEIIHNIASPLFLIGTLTSAVVGLGCIRFLLKYLRNNNFAIFAVYRLALAVAVAAVYFVKAA